MTFKPESLTIAQLLKYYGQILEELRARKIIRTSNIPTGDYAEFLVKNQLELILEKGNRVGYDAKDASGVKFQIKARRLTGNNQSWRLGAIRNLANQEFDFLIAVKFNGIFEIDQVVKIPHKIIEKYARYSRHSNAHFLVLGEVLSDPLLEDLTTQFLK